MYSNKMLVMKKVTPLLVRLIITKNSQIFWMLHANVILSLHNSNQQNRFIRS